MIDKRDAIALLRAHYKDVFDSRCDLGDDINIYDPDDQNFLCDCALEHIHTPEICEMIEELRATDDPYDYQALAQHGFDFEI